MIEADSDVACHMWLRHSKKIPQKHLKPIIIRGVPGYMDARFCFVAYDDLEQIEHGDTLHHTFIWPSWSVCQTRYFYLWATNDGEAMISTSPIFEKHFVQLPDPTYFYPDPHIEATSVDGWVRQAVTCPACSWSDVRDGAGDDSRDDGPELITMLWSWRNAGEYNAFYRIITLFDTSIINDDHTIYAAELLLFGKVKTVEPAWPASALSVVDSNPASDHELVDSDYTTLGETALSNLIPFASIDDSGSNRFILNLHGHAKIAREGITKLGIREHTYDRRNIEPPFSPHALARADFWSSENVDILKRPTLIVWYD